MIKMFKTSTMLSTCLALGLVMGCAKAETASAENGALSKAEIETIVRNYILAHPEIISQALILNEEQEKVRAIERIAKELRHDSRDYSMGPKNAKVTIVEFFDYNCSYCKQSTDWMQKTMAKYPKNVRVIFKELPILDSRTKTSRNAAKAALAAHQQGKYSEMHFALMDGMVLTDKFINDTAKRLGLNLSKFKKAMESDAVADHLEDTLALASKVPELTGTPFFMINNDYIPGGNTTALQKMLDAALKGS